MNVFAIRELDFEELTAVSGGAGAAPSKVPNVRQIDAVDIALSGFNGAVTGAVTGAPAGGAAGFAMGVTATAGATAVLGPAGAGIGTILIPATTAAGTLVGAASGAVTGGAIGLVGGAAQELSELLFGIGTDSHVDVYNKLLQDAKAAIAAHAEIF